MHDINDKKRVISSVQNYLNKIKKSFSVIPNGNYDNRTESAVRQFQADNDIPVTGVIDLITFNEIYKSYLEITENELLHSKHSHMDLPIQIGDANQSIPHIVSILEKLADYYRIDYNKTSSFAYTNESAQISIRLKEIYHIENTDSSLDLRLYDRMVNDLKSIEAMYVLNE